MSRRFGVLMAMLSLVVAAGIWLVGQMHVDLPPISNLWGSTGIFDGLVTSSGLDQICDEVMRTDHPDLVWKADAGNEEARDRPARVPFAELRRHIGQPVRIAGVLAAATMLYPSWIAMTSSPWPDGPAPGRPLPLDLHLVWPRMYPAAVSPWVADRCVAAEGTPELSPSAASSSHLVLARVRRLEVWSEPHRPVVHDPSPSNLPARGAVLRDLRHQLDASGPAAVRASMSSNRDLWRAFADGVRSGDAGWLVLAVAVRTEVAGQDAAELREALRWALHWNPPFTLRLLLRQQLPVGALCGTDQDDDTDFERVVWMIDERLASLIGFEDAALGPTARRCVAQLRAARSLLLFRAEEPRAEWWKDARSGGGFRR